MVLFQEGASEYEEVEKELGSKAVKSGSKGNLNGEGETKDRGMLRRLFSPVFLEAFVLTFLAEWGDRSQVGLPMHPFCTQPTPDFPLQLPMW